MPDVAMLTGLVREGIRATPVVKYAMGLAGIAAAIAIVRGLLPDVGLAAMLPLMVGAIIVMALLAVFAAAIERRKTSVSRRGAPATVDHPVVIGTVFLWAVCIFVIVFMFFTVTAVAGGWPSYVAGLLPKAASDTSLATAIRGPNPPDLPKKIRPMWTAVNDDWPESVGAEEDFQRVQNTVLRQCGACMKPKDESTVAFGGVSNTAGSRIAIDATACRTGVRLALRGLKLMQANYAPMAMTVRYSRVDIEPGRMTHVLIDDMANVTIAPIACLDQ